MPNYNYSYNVPSFQSMMGTSPTDILSLLQGYRGQNYAQELAGSKELAQMGYDTQKALAGMGYNSARDLAGMGYQSAAELQKEQLAKQELLARLGYGSQKELQTLAGNQALEQMQRQSDLDWQRRASESNMRALELRDLSSQAFRNRPEYYDAPTGFGGTLRQPIVYGGGSFIRGTRPELKPVRQ